MNWYDELEFFSSGKFDRIVERIKQDKKSGHQILPASRNVLRAFSETPLDEVKVVILGQDPYPNEKHAMGLAFSVPEGNGCPPSLKNIFHEVCMDLHKEARDKLFEKQGGPSEFESEYVYNTDLTRWARQGVLLLNTSLTVVAGQRDSHRDIGWQALTNDVLRLLNEKKDHLVFILWGAHARKKAMFIDQTKHLVIESAHPSPLSAHRGFFGSRPFSRTNKYLIEHGKEPIEW